MKKNLPEYYSRAWVQADILCGLTAEDGAFLDMIAEIRESGTLEDLERKVKKRQAGYRAELAILQNQIKKEIAADSKKDISDSFSDKVRWLFSGIGELIDTHPIACVFGLSGLYLVLSLVSLL